MNEKKNYSKKYNINDYEECLQKLTNYLGDLFYETEKSFYEKRIDNTIDFKNFNNDQRTKSNNNINIINSILRGIKNFKLMLMIEMEKNQNLIVNAEKFF